jgi:putative salt-induced outer membrane protein YdiY
MAFITPRSLVKMCRVATALTVLAVSGPRTALAQAPDDLEAAEFALHAAIAAKDRPALLDLLSSDFRVDDGRDRDRWIAAVMSVCGGGRTSLKTLQPVMRGDTALVSFEATATLEPPCDPTTVRTRVADVWAFENGGWHLTLRSIVPLTSQAPAAAGNWMSSVELTAISSQGNVSSFTLGSNGEVTWQHGRSRTNARASVLRTIDQGVERARSFSLQLRETRTMTATLSLFGHGAYQRDLFAGIRHRYGGDAGLGLLLSSDGHRLQATVGVGSTREERVNSAARSTPVATAGVQYRLTLSPSTTLSEDGETTASLTRGSDWRFENTLGLTTVLRQPFSLRASYNSRYVNNPVPGFQRLDAVLSLGFVARF